MKEEKFIKKIDILIGQDTFRSFDPIISFIINDRYTTTKLEDLKSYIDDIWENKDNRSEKSHKAYNNLKEMFYEILSPFIDFDYILNKGKK